VRLNSEYIPPPDDETIYKEHRRELNEAQMKNDKELRERKRWKNSRHVPENYHPPTSREDLWGRIRMGETYFANATFHGEDFREFPGHETRFNFSGAHFSDCNFYRSNFDRADFGGALFERCTGFDSFSCENADFTEAVFLGTTTFSAETKLQGAIFRSADLRDVEGFVLDGNLLYFTKTPKYIESDTWSELRRKYNGFSLFINALLLLLFVGPFITRLV
jgi:hypothetical protein